jgi:long-subunit acyl-CoA synthetase (AMP-forming)
VSHAKPGPVSRPQPRTMCAAFQATAARVPDSIAVRTPDSAVSLTWLQYAQWVQRLAGGLAALGVRRADTVGIMLTNRPEFHVVDTAVLHAGGIPFSVYNTLAAEQIKHLFINAGNNVVICEEQFASQVMAAAPDMAHIVCVDADLDGTLSLADVEALPAPDGFDFDESWQAVDPGDVLTIIYTSGTTGPPKGVELTHANLLAAVEATLDNMPMDETDSVISYLPDAHVANRWGAHYCSLVSGMQIVTLADVKQAVAVLPAVRPTIFGAVPQIWYKIKVAIEAALAQEQSPVKRRMARWAIGTGRRVAQARAEQRAVPLALAAQHAVADRLVLSKLRARLGFDRVRLAATGAAAIAPEALEFILGLGIPCAEGWGMSETSGLATINPIDGVRIGTVGTAMRGATFSLADDGELLVRGPLVMKGYRGEPEKTAETIDAQGWLHTGDIASIDDDGYIRIVDRKKELIINAAGKNMSPANIEGTIRVSCPLVGSAVAVGDDRPYVVALLTLDADAAAAFAAKHGLAGADPAVLADNPALLAEVEAGIAAANSRLSRVEQIKKWAILPDVWEPGGEELTPTMKLKRRPISQKYADRIDALYARS